jgi:hypothetical protein
MKQDGTACSSSISYGSLRLEYSVSQNERKGAHQASLLVNCSRTPPFLQ